MQSLSDVYRSVYVQLLGFAPRDESFYELPDVALDAMESAWTAEEIADELAAYDEYDEDYTLYLGLAHATVSWYAESNRVTS